MSIFATEFPAKPNIDKAKFVAASIAWIRGIKNSTVLEAATAKEMYSDDVWLEASSGESLSLKSFEQDSRAVFGVRLEIPDSEGRRWRTECVYSKFNEKAYLRVRGQCLAVRVGASVLSPLKPHFISQSIEDGWSSKDGFFEVSSLPIELSNSDLEIARSVFLGKAVEFLPCVYVSRNNDDSLPLDPKVLARKLAGVSHVIVEPSRRFSFELMTLSERKNPYGGAVGIFLPDGRELRRYFKRPLDATGVQLAEVCIVTSSQVTSGFAARHGWEWQQLQEAQSRLLRENIVSKKSEDIDEYIDAFDTELKAKNEQIENLKILLEIARAEHLEDSGNVGNIVPSGLASKIGPEIYDGEFSDRLRFYLTSTALVPNEKIDSRTKEFVKKLINSTEFTGRATSLINQIKGACRDGNEMPQKLGAFLAGYGYSKSQDGKHIKYDPPKELFGTTIEIIPSTPSDSQRGGRNRGADVIRGFGLSQLR